MKLAICLFDYFPFGGMQKDMLTIARACQQRGHEVTVLAKSWQGEQPRDLRIVILASGALTNTQRNRDFVKQKDQYVKEENIDRVIGFSKMPGLDVYYAADSCFMAKALEQRGAWYALTPRFKHFTAWEKTVFGKEANTLGVDDF